MDEVNVAIGIDQENGDTVIGVTGVLDAEAAARIGAIVTQAEPRARARVVIDVCKAREVTAVALAALADAIASEGLRVRGLTQRHRQILRLLSPPRAADAGAARR